MAKRKPGGDREPEAGLWSEIITAYGCSANPAAIRSFIANRGIPVNIRYFFIIYYPAYSLNVK